MVKSSWGALRRAQVVFKSSWGRKGEHKLWSRVHGGVKESTSCVQEFMGALSRAQAVSKSLWGR